MRVVVAQFRVVETPPILFILLGNVQGPKHPIEYHQLGTQVLVPMPKLRTMMDLMENGCAEDIV